MRCSSWIFVLLLAGCNGLTDRETALDTPLALDECRAGPFLLVDVFEGARLGQCVAVSSSKVKLRNAPEDRPINHSPWYAFKVAEGEGQLEVELQYMLHAHRYHPKVSTDGQTWRRLDDARISVEQEGKLLRLNLDVEQTPLWISAQELITQDHYDQWLDEVQSQYGGSVEVLGLSRGNRAIYGYLSPNRADHLVILLGRAHPPEVTGAIAMQHFVDRLLERYEADLPGYQLLIVPSINPDGVALGHWRHGMGHLDLNRDWGVFSQPETRAVIRKINALVEDGAQPVAMLDFHSTQRNLFYTQSKEEEEVYGGFSTQWLNLARQKGAYEFDQVARHNSGGATSKNYFFQRFGIPATTYEVGDETDRAEIRDSAITFADAFVEVLGER